MPDGDRDSRIAQRAHELWEQAGRPEGQHVEHWLEAERQVAPGGEALPGGGPGTSESAQGIARAGRASSASPGASADAHHAERGAAGEIASEGQPGSSAENEGEGSRTAARAYNKHTQEFVQSGQVEEKAREAEAALAGAEAPELAKAEQKGKRKSRGEDPALAG